MATLFIVVKISINNKINQIVVYSKNKILLNNIKGELLLYTTAWINTTDIVLGERSQKQQTYAPCHSIYMKFKDTE